MTKFPVLLPKLQLGFYERLQQAQQELLLPALLDHIGTLDIAILDQNLMQFAGQEKLAFTAQKGIRGELVFPVPYVLSSKPKLLGYYRLLLGFSQKQFYSGPFSRFQRMEKQNDLTTGTEALLDPCCESLIASAWFLVNGLPDLSQRTLNALTLLTLGPQFRGSRNVSLGVEAIASVFDIIKTIVADRTRKETDTSLEIESAVGRIYRIEFAPDPDIAIRQVLKNGSFRNRIAIEVKGGTDFSNIHNRLGEAEKSHQKAKADGFTQFWTVINVGTTLSTPTWRQETPTTNELFYLEELENSDSQEYTRFEEYLVSELGI
jgi:hypothetical protein